MEGSPIMTFLQRVQSILVHPQPQPIFAPGAGVLATSERGTEVFGRVRYFDDKRDSYKVDYYLPSGGLFSGWFAEWQLEAFEIANGRLN